MENNNLSEYSTNYYEESNLYKIFSLAEDREEKIWHSISKNFTNKMTLDLGCGNGIYLDKIKKETNYYVGLDQSCFQIKNSKNSHPFVVASGNQMPFKDNTFDCILSCWVWGTVVSEQKRQQIFNESLRILKNNGKIILIENAPGSEFEYLRGRHLNNKTEEYNIWIEDNKFKMIKELEIDITFKTRYEAQKIFKSIWKDRLFSLPKDKTIKNDIVIFELIK